MCIRDSSYFIKFYYEMARTGTVARTGASTLVFSSNPREQGRAQRFGGPISVVKIMKVYIPAAIS